jgi:hypothetical protein
MKLQTIGNAIQTLNKLAGMSLPIKIAYRLKRLLKKVEEAWNPAADQISALVEKHGQPNEDGTFTVRPDTEAFQAFTQEFEELMDTTIEIEFEKIGIDEFGDIRISAVELEAIAWLIADGSGGG